MNILREIRLLSKKGARSKYKTFVILYVLLIVSTYAWYWTYPNMDLSNLKGEVDSWEILYKYDDKNLEDEVLISINDFCPGTNYIKTIYIYNIGKKSSYITTELKDVRIFGESKMIYLTSTEGAMETSSNNNIVYLFGNEDYPFEISYILNRNYIYTQYCEDNPASTPNAVATLTISINWDFESQNSAEDTNTNIRDSIDTELGRKAYNYYEGTKVSTTDSVTDSVSDSIVHSSTDSVTDSITDSSTDSVEEDKDPAVEIKILVKGVKYEGDIPTE